MVNINIQETNEKITEDDTLSETDEKITDDTLSETPFSNSNNRENIYRSAANRASY